MLLVALDIGHKYKLSNPTDRGASYQGTFEADLVEQYVHAAQDMLASDLDVHAIVSDPWDTNNGLVGDYAARHAWCNEQKIPLYIQCHLNAGGGAYSLVGYATDISPEQEPVIAKILEHQTEAALGLYPHDHYEELTADSRGFCTVNGLNGVGLLYEPCFLDNPQHFTKLMTGEWIEKIAQALVATIQQVVRDEVLS